MLKLLNFTDIIDCVYGIIDNGDGYIDRTDRKVVHVCAIVEHGGHFISSSDEIMDFLSKNFNSHIDHYPYGSG